jgi:hypothetical protein
MFQFCIGWGMAITACVLGIWGGQLIKENWGWWRPKPSAAPNSPPQPNVAEQSTAITTGDNSPAVGTVHGDFNFNSEPKKKKDNPGK